VSTEFEPVNPIFGEDETQIPGKIELQILGKMGTPTFGEDGSPALRKLELQVWGAWPVDSTCFVRWHSGQKDVSTL